MNVMMKAHQIARQVRVFVKSYREALVIGLKRAHKAAKEKMTMIQVDMLERLNKRLEKLKAFYKNDAVMARYMVTCDNLPINMESGRTVNVENATTWASIQFARSNASKVKNGRGTVGQAVNVGHQVEYEMQNVCRMINELA